MVSGDIPNYKSNKGYYSAPSSHAPSSLSSAKRYAGGNALRPWPPMYRTPMSRAQMATYQALSTAAVAAATTAPPPPPTKLNYNNFNGNHYGYNNSIYGRANKFNFHQFNMVAAAAAEGKYASAMNLANKKNAKNYYLISQPYMKNSLAMPSPPPSNGSSGSFYGRTTTDYPAMNNGNLMLMPQDKEKNRFRKLRNPTQTSPVFRSSCATCIRSKSMEDVRTEIVTDWPTYNKENYNEFKKNRLNNGGNGGAAAGNAGPLGLMKHGVRRSMDNLLEVETSSFGKRFQVRFEKPIDLSFFPSFETRKTNKILYLSPQISWPIQKSKLMRFYFARHFHYARFCFAHIYIFTFLSNECRLFCHSSFAAHVCLSLINKSIQQGNFHKLSHNRQ